MTNTVHDDLTKAILHSENLIKDAKADIDNYENKFVTDAFGFEIKELHRMMVLNMREQLSIREERLEFLKSLQQTEG